MTGIGTVDAIHIAPAGGAEVQAVDSVEGVSGRGLRGDRYFDGTGTFYETVKTGRDITVIEKEAIEAIEREAGIVLDPGEHRRNVTTRDVALNHLVNQRFRIGGVVCRGVRLCEPCSHLESLTVTGTSDALVHRGGLRADIVESGMISVGDSVEPV